MSNVLLPKRLFNIIRTETGIENNSNTNTIEALNMKTKNPLPKPKTEKNINNQDQTFNKSNKIHKPNSLVKLPTSRLNKPKILFELSNEEIIQILESNSNLCQIINPKDIKVIATGSCGKVLEAKSIKVPNKHYALKLQYCPDERSINYLTNEVQIGHSLKNKHINEQRGFYALKDDYKAIATEMQQNGDLDSLKKVMKRSCFVESFVLYLANHIFKGLRFMHRNKIAHLDIKMQNILIDDHLNAKLADFSISLDYSDLVGEYKLKRKGTIFYMPPEVVNQEVINIEDINKVDVWGVGVLMYFLLFNDFPYGLRDNYQADDKEKYTKMLKGVIEAQLVITEGKVSNEMEELLRGCLERNINKRLSIEEVMKMSWVEKAIVIEDERVKYNEPEKFLVALITDNILGL